tara:strand:- start:51 stop:794 length:744 start_codon:yes stop_codon:yes gene_type:complete
MSYFIKCKNASLDVAKYNNNFRFFGTKQQIKKTKILKNINMAINEGETIGLIGSNGAGKSTLLRLLAGIYKETSGKIEKNGACHGFFGNIFFDENLSGIEFLYNSLLLYGMTPMKINEIMPKVIDFIDIDEYIYKTIHTYSEGMKARLSVSSLLYSRPKILLLDEGIGAGDRFFMKKTKKQIDNFIKDTPIVLLASHNEKLLKQFCKETYLMHNGEIIGIDKTAEMIKYYKSKTFYEKVSTDNEKNY